MAYWLVKSDPDEYSFYDLLRDKETTWSGVRNYAARNNLSAMAKGDTVLVYHSNNEKAVLGSAVVSKTAFQDPTTDETAWVAIELKATELLAKQVSLAQMKKDSQLANIGLIRIGRLSVMPLTTEEYSIIISMSKE